MRRKNAAKARATRLSVCCADWAGSGVSSSWRSAVKSWHCCTYPTLIRWRFQAARRCSMVGILAELARSLMQERTKVGRAAAKARGVKMGRKPLLSPQQAAHARKLREQGESPAQVAQLAQGVAAHAGKGFEGRRRPACTASGVTLRRFLCTAPVDEGA